MPVTTTFPQVGLAILDLEVARWAPGWLQWLAALITRPFAADREVIERRCWESLRRYLPDAEVERLH